MLPLYGGADVSIGTLPGLLVPVGSGFTQLVRHESETWPKPKSLIAVAKRLWCQLVQDYAADSVSPPQSCNNTVHRPIPERTYIHRPRWRDSRYRVNGAIGPTSSSHCSRATTSRRTQAAGDAGLRIEPLIYRTCTWILIVGTSICSTGSHFWRTESSVTRSPSRYWPTLNSYAGWAGAGRRNQRRSCRSWSCRQSSAYED